MTSPTITVVVCAYTMDRIDHVRAALRSIEDQSVQPEQTILVADHNAELASLVSAEFLNVEVLPNSGRQGLSGARNTGIAAARGEVVAFLDDDAQAAPDWLAHLLAPYSDNTVIAVGGSAEPVWPIERPAFLPHELDWIVGCTYEGQPRTTTDVRNVMGCNMSFRREVFATAGTFTEGLGRVGRTPLGAEETELCIRAQHRIPGSRIVFAPEARVRHRVSDDRTTWGYLVRRSYAEGLSKAHVSRLVGADSATSTERGYVLHTLPRGVARQLKAGLSAPAQAAGAAGIVTALGATVGGYLRGRVRRPRSAAGV